MRSLWLLYELGVKFELVPYAFDGAIKTADYLALNPSGRVPSLEIDGSVLFESGAIAEFLCERYSPTEIGRAVKHAERAAWLNWVHFAETMSQHTANLTQQHIMLFEDWMRSPTVMKLEAKRLAKTFGAVDAALAGQDYLLPSGFSAADIGVGQAVFMGSHFVKLDPFPALSAWYARLQARPAFQRALPQGDGLYRQDFYAPWEVVRG
jgi:glutathione S-transferase